jgi:recombination protein RecA
MARKKVSEESSKVDISTTDVVLAIIEKQYGRNIMVPAEKLIEYEPKVISWSPQLDIGLGGGIPEGSWGLISGPPKFGKTTALMTLAASCQRPENGGRNCYYCKVEGRLSKKNFEIKGLNVGSSKPGYGQLFVFESTEDKILTAEDFLGIVETAVMNDPGCLVIIDSYSSLCPESVMANDFTSQSRSTTPKLLKNFCDKMGQIVPIKKAIIVGVMKEMANTSGWGSPVFSQGGNAIKFQEDWRIEVKDRKYIHPGDDKSKKAIGQQVTWNIANSALGAPGMKVISYVKYGVGIDKLRENKDIAIELELIDKSGSWFYVLPEKYGEDHKIQGDENLVNYLEENEELMEEVEKEIRSVMYGE